ncbi:SDR family oxidoreductase [Nocardia cyriacigeorgica]|uniref:SDR family oxidoreductase n=1 Tax=Nocardia cyriacigeorgica TaxID=135487 RepID=UPI0018944E90|nr:SDR family oxidoreductase [Nocardia cyriacigeorgica]MBF6089928.1 SDR family oxidoreductase [Nocardia cyriacigeorgica]MBF6399614.1 SDR family oxidoreductase [Nocardia cyriacigeorgica]MBF6405244.1 SDR family oxidoreductase [Nocardia cyriacigeorgica]
MATGRAGTALLNPPALVRTLTSLVRSGGEENIAGKTVLLTGASSGVGKAAAHKLGAHGANLVLVARGEQELCEVRDTVRAAGGKAEALVCDLSDGAAVDALAERIDAEVGKVDVLVNNAGRSIRRRAADASDRFHDYERTMALNYFGATRLTMALLPSMLAARDGHIINIATWGVAAGSMPMFTAYHASKAALGAFGRSLGAETRPHGVHVTTIGYPLVRTEMIAPTAEYEAAPALSAEAAADWILTAIRTRPIELYPRYGRLLQAIGAISPRAVDNLIWRMGI